MTGCRRPPPVSLPPCVQSPPVSDADSTLTGFRVVDCPLRLRVDDAFACYREDDRDWMDAWRVQQSCPASRHDTLISHLYADREQAPEFLEQSPRRSSGPALRSDQRNRRQTDKLQVLSWNPGPARATDWSMLATHLIGPWPVVCVQEGAGFVTDSSLAENFYVITQHHCAVLLKKDTFARDFTCTLIQVPCSLMCCSWAVEGMAVTGKFSRAPDPSCSNFTVANVHINNECAKRRSVCIVLLLLIRDLCMQHSAVILTGDFTKGAERELASSAPHRPTSDLSARGRLQLRQRPVAYFWCYAIVGPRRRAPRLHVARMLWMCCAPRVAKPVVNYAPRVHQLRLCHHWVEDHGPNDQTWHYEQWLHLKFAGRKRRRDASCVLCF